MQDVEAALFLRKDIKRLGFAPLTSMYWFDETDKRRLEDWRPEVHDSDGLAIWTGAGERIWRPLDQPAVRRHVELRRQQSEEVSGCCSATARTRTISTG